MKGVQPAGTAVVFLAHQFSLSAARRFERLRRETLGEADCHVLLHDDGGPVRDAWQTFLAQAGAPQSLRLFRPEALVAALGHPLFGGKGLLGNVHFPLLWFARETRHRWFWQIESDVEYRGAWPGLLRGVAHEEAALLAAHVHHHAQRPDWYWWASAIAPPALRLRRSAWRKAFFPVCRFSREALGAIDAAHRAGWHAHFEALIPTALAAAGLPVRDLLQVQPCYEGGEQDPGAPPQALSTIRWRPEISRAEFTTRGAGALLFHPIKQDWWFDGAAVLSV